jgi:hypothetical protein
MMHVLAEVTFETVFASVIGSCIVGVMAYTAKYLRQIPGRLESIENKLENIVSQQTKHASDIEKMTEKVMDHEARLRVTESHQEHHQ